MKEAESTSFQPDVKPVAVNPYLEGNFAPVEREQTFDRLRVSGELPRELTGVLLRNGPNPVGAVDAKHHWFIGDAMLHAIEIADGGARAYRNRFVRTPAIERSLGLAAAPRSSQPLPLQGSGNVNVIEHAGRILALPEVGLPYELDGQLGTRGEYDFGGALRSSMTAHPKIDPVSGELLLFGYDFGPVHLRYHRATKDGTLDRTIEIATPKPSMIHDFGVTQSRVVFMDLPVQFDVELAVNGYRMPFRWNDRAEARIGVMSRAATTDSVRWIEIEPCYVYHVLNAYDDGAKIVMDVVRYPRTFDQNRTWPIEDQLGKLVRWTIDEAAGTMDEQPLDLTPQEFPRVNPRFETLAHRYGYAVELDPDPSGFHFRGLLKHDLKTGTHQRHDVGAGRAASEGVFVPRGAGEDEGYLIAPVYDARTNTSDVIVIDAQDFAGPPLATIHLPVRIPFGFHGNFVLTA
jgi:carotenoid cleavage dioxygenase